MSIALAVALVALPGGPGGLCPLEALPVDVLTVYHAVPEQTDDNPTETADGTLFTVVDVESGAVRIAALSREMLAFWGGPVQYGDAIWIEVEDKRLSGLWYVHDTMSETVSGYVDLLVSEIIVECWITEDADVKHPEGCTVSPIAVYHLGGSNGKACEPGTRWTHRSGGAANPGCTWHGIGYCGRECQARHLELRESRGLARVL